MRILAVSVAPLFRDRVIGGSQRILMEVVDALAEAGHDVRVLSSRVAGSETRFLTPGGATVEPTLELRGAFPAPYQTAPHRLNSVWRRLAEGAAWADRAYLHADAIHMRAALGEVPVVRSLHDFVYEEALLSAFTLPATRTVVPSQYLKDCVLASAGLVADPGEIIIVPNGIDSRANLTQPRLPDGLRPLADDDLVLLHPHRLQPEKGIEQSMLIALEVQRRLPERRVRLLVPALDHDGSLDEAALAATSVQGLAEATGASEMLELHSWLGTEQMDGYYVAGHVTLCPGSFVESFGLVPLESVVAGTPAVCARVGAFREQVGIAGIRHFDCGDVQSAATAVLAAASELFDSDAARREVGERYDRGEMRKGYVEAVSGPLPAAYAPLPTVPTTGWRLAPWCYVDGSRIYHDYLARFAGFPELTAALRVSGTVAERNPDRLGPDAAAEFERARDHGFIVPV